MLERDQVYPPPQPRDNPEPYRKPPTPGLPGATAITAPPPGKASDPPGPAEPHFRLGAVGGTGRNGGGGESLRLSNTSEPMDKDS